jgi:hypothetical protein
LAVDSKVTKKEERRRNKETLEKVGRGCSKIKDLEVKE